MKIMVVTPYYYPKVGGLEIYARQLSIALKEHQQCEIVIVTSNHEGRRSIHGQIDNMNIHRLGVWMKLSNTPVNLAWPFQIRRIIKKEHPDVILAHTPVPSMSDAAALAAGKTPFVVVYHAATLLKGGIVFRIVASIYGIYERVTLGRANRIFAVSEYVKQQLRPAFVSKTSVVPNAVWRAQITKRTQPDEINFLFVGSLDRTHSWKGLDLIIDAMALFKKRGHKDFTLTVVGDGNDRARYETLVKERGLEKNIIFLGVKTGDEKDAEFRRATALVMYPSSPNDAFPTVMLEAWARYVPVIAGAIGPIPTLVNDMIDGYLVAARNVDALAECLDKVAGSSTQERANIAKVAAARTRDMYTWELQAKSVASKLKELL